MADLNVAIAILGKDEASGPIGKIVGSLKDLGGIADVATKPLGFLGTTLAVAAGTILPQALGAVKNFVTGSVGEFASFQTGMNEVFTLLPGISADAMSAMSGDVKQFARDMRVLPEDVVPALYQSLSAGVPPDNVFEFLETAQKVAKGGVTDLATAVDGISSVVNAYGAEMMDATRASDLMFTAVKLGKTDFSQLSSSIFNVTPSAAGLGVGFDTVTASLATLTAMGVPTSVATTQMRAMFDELGKSGSSVDTIFRDLAGQSFRDFVASGGDTQEALALLKEHADANNLSMKDLFSSTEAGGAALVLAGKGAESFDNALREMEASAGATDAAYGTMNRGLDVLKDTFIVFGKTAKLEFMERVAPALEVVGGWLADRLPAAMDLFTGAMDSTLGTLGKAFGYIQRGLSGGDLFAVFEDGSSYIGGFLEALGMSEGLANRAGAAIGWLADRASDLAAGFREGGLQGALEALGPHVQAAFDGAVAYVQGQLPVWQAQLLAWGQATWQWIVDTIPELHGRWMELRAQLIGWAIQAGIELGGKLLEWGQSLWAWIGPQIPVLIGQAQELANQFLGWIGQQAPLLLERFLTWKDSVVAWITPVATDLLGKAQEMAAQLLGWIGEQAPPLLARFSAWKDSFVAWIVPATVDFLNRWPGMLNQFLDWIGTAAGPILRKLGDWAVSFVSWIIPMIPDILAALGAGAVAGVGVLGAILAFIGQTVGVLGAKLLLWAGAFLDWIWKEVIPKIIPELAKVENKIVGWIGDAARAVLREAKKIGDSILRGIGAGIDSANQWLKDKVGEVANLLPKWLKDRLGIKSPSRVMADEVGAPMGQGIVMGLQKALDLSQGQIRSVIQPFVNGIKSLMYGDFDGFIEGLGFAMAPGADDILSDRQMAALEHLRNALGPNTGGLPGGYVDAPWPEMGEQAGESMAQGIVGGLQKGLMTRHGWIADGVEHILDMLADPNPLPATITNPLEALWQHFTEWAGADAEGQDLNLWFNEEAQAQLRGFGRELQHLQMMISGMSRDEWAGFGVPLDEADFRNRIDNFGAYVRDLLTDGEYLSDWLTHFPEHIQWSMKQTGQAFSEFIRNPATGLVDLEGLRHLLVSGGDTAAESVEVGIELAESLVEGLSDEFFRKKDWLIDSLKDDLTDDRAQVSMHNVGISLGWNIAEGIASELRRRAEVITGALQAVIAPALAAPAAVPAGAGGSSGGSGGSSRTEQLLERIARAVESGEDLSIDVRGGSAVAISRAGGY
jgi:TP901 family phage tail tape measure protein